MNQAIESTKCRPVGIEPGYWNLNRAARIFLMSVVGILLATGLAKLSAVFKGGASLQFRDVLFPFLTQKQVLIAAALMEFAVVWGLLTQTFDSRTKLAVVAWTSVIFLFYRLGHWFLRGTDTCGCLGLIAEALGNNAANLIAKMALGYLFVGSCVFLCVVSIWGRKPGLVENVENVENGQR